MIKHFRLFFQGALLSYKALFRWLRPSAYIASKIIAPLNQILFFTFLGMYASGQKDASFFIIGNAVQMAAVSGIYGVTMSIGGDRWEGTLPYLFGTPANRFVMFFGRGFFHILDGFLGVWIGLFLGVILLGLDLSAANFPMLLLIILITTFSTSGLGLLLGCLSLITRNVMFVNNTVYFLLLIFAGANIPLESMPPWMHSISRSLPLTRGISTARAAIAGSPASSILPVLLEELLIGLGYMLFGFMLFRWFEQAAKRRGTLEAM
ncbi:MAG: ABC transporter permease [Anaerolineales bacterium]|nr:ABC transporter permease [Anaerolineales bacterium]